MPVPSQIRAYALATHLFQTVHGEPVSLHGRPDLRRQRAQELTRPLLFARVRHGQRGDEIDKGVGVRFVLVEPQVDHGVGRSGIKDASTFAALGWPRSWGWKREIQYRDGARRDVMGVSPLTVAG